MAIGNVIQKGSTIYVYDEKGKLIRGLSAGSGPKDGLKGYTSTMVNIQRGSTIYSYNEKGAVVSAKSA